MDKNLKLFEKSNNIRDLIQIIAEYLYHNPPTLGHGFSHFINVARTSYMVSVQNKFNLDETAYITGLLHDIYRPALGQAGKEDHEKKCSEVAKKLLSRSGYSEFAKTVSDAILEKDDQIFLGTASVLTKIISISDKIEMNNQRGIAYTWASNRELKRLNQGIVYNNFIEVMRDFAKYQPKAWQVFNSLKILGVKEAIKSYSKSNIELLDLVKKEAEGKIKYKTESIKISKLEANLEVKYLKNFDVTNASIRKIAKNYSVLL